MGVETGTEFVWVYDLWKMASEEVFSYLQEFKYWMFF